MANAFYVNLINSDDITDRETTFRNICAASSPIVNCSPDGFRLRYGKDDLGELFQHISGTTRDEIRIYFIHNSDVPIKSMFETAKSEWPQNAYAIFYSGAVIKDIDCPPELNKMLNIKCLMARFPTEVKRVTSYRFELLVRAVQAAAIGDSCEFSKIDINSYRVKPKVLNVWVSLFRSIDTAIYNLNKKRPINDVFNLVRSDLTNLLNLTHPHELTCLNKKYFESFDPSFKIEFNELLKNDIEASFMNLQINILNNEYAFITIDQLEKARSTCSELISKCK